MPQATVIIPHLNQWEHLTRCLQALTRQTLSNNAFNIIVVDNGSSDFSEQQPQIAQDFPFVTFLQEAKPGPGPARNTAIAASKDDLILCIDADCIADANWVKSAISHLTSSGPGTIYGGDVLIGMLDPKHPTPLEAYETIFAFRQQLYIEKKNFSGTGNLAFWKSDHQKIGPFAEIGIAEDLDWGHRAHRLGFKIRFVPEMIVSHPARTTMRELQHKWERHIAHQLHDIRQKKLSTLKWAALTFAVGASWLPDLRKIWLSDRLPNIKARWDASRILIQIRLFRARNMISQIFQRDSSAAQWNRS